MPQWMQRGGAGKCDEVLCSWQVLKEVFNFYYSVAGLFESLFECLNWMHFNCALLFWERAGSERRWS